MITEKLPEKIRYPIQQFICKTFQVIPASARYGKVFWQTYNFLQESQRWSKEKLERYQIQQLRKLLHHAYENVPYYHRIFNENGLKPNYMKELEDLKKLPCLDKDTFKLHRSEMMAKNVTLKHLNEVGTNGTTGKPLHFYQDKSEIEKEWAFVVHQWGRVGYRPGDPRIEIIRLRGEEAGFSGRIEYIPTERVLRLSPHIDKATTQYYLKKMKPFGAKFLHGYPSTIASLAHMVKKYSFKVEFKLKAVFFVSEIVYDWQKELVQEVFNCRVFAHYGLTEHVATATECECDFDYHFVPQYGITEIDPNSHEIIATGFLNFVNPFIRYRTGDCVSLAVFSKCDCCGRNYFPVVDKIEGRLMDFIVTPQGALVNPSVLIWPIRKYFGEAKESQLVQTSVNRIILSVAPYNKNVFKIAKGQLRQLYKDYQRILGSDVQIEVEIVDEIERKQSGKFRFIISEVSKDLVKKGLNEF